MQPLLKCKREKKKKDDINLLKGQRKFIPLQQDAENDIKLQQEWLLSFRPHRLIKGSFQREFSVGRFFLEPKNVWEIMLQMAVPEAGRWQK